MVDIDRKKQGNYQWKYNLAKHICRIKYYIFMVMLNDAKRLDGKYI